MAAQPAIDTDSIYIEKDSCYAFVSDNFDFD